MTTPAGGGNKPSGSIIVAIFLIVALGLLVIGGVIHSTPAPRPRHRAGRAYPRPLSGDAGHLHSSSSSASPPASSGRSSASSAPAPSAGADSRQQHAGDRLDGHPDHHPRGASSSRRSCWCSTSRRRPPRARSTSRSRPSATSGGGSSSTARGDRQSTTSRRRRPNYDDLVPPALVVPVGKVVVAKVRSTDVIHSFYAPSSCTRSRPMPGNMNQMHFKAREGQAFTRPVLPVLRPAPLRHALRPRRALAGRLPEAG